MNRGRLAFSGCLGIAMLSCGSTPPLFSTSPSVAAYAHPARGARPAQEVAAAAIAGVYERAQRCFPPASTHGARVQGAFEGENGAFVVQSIDAPGCPARRVPTTSEAACVRTAFADARVPAFVGANMSAIQVVVPRTEPSPSSSPSTLPGYDLHRVSAIMHANLAGLERCYNAALARTPTLAMRVDACFTIQPDGHTSRVRTEITRAVDGVAPANDVVSCMRNVIARLGFDPPPEGAIEFSYGFNFEPGL